MTMESGKETFRLGFLTAIEVPERGFVGGLLVTNHFGRPLEFQCTAPLKPNRAQEILYGPTLIPYVLGDLIGRTLIEKVGVKPHLVLTERNDLLPMRDLVSIPVACVDDFLASAPALPAPNGPETTAPPLAAETSDPSTVPTERGDAGGAATIADASPASESLPIPPPAAQPHFRLGRQILRFHAAHAEDQAIARQGAASVPTDADLREPFERVREALSETAKSGGGR
jgi:hypothetical protein